MNYLKTIHVLDLFSYILSPTVEVEHYTPLSSFKVGQLEESVTDQHFFCPTLHKTPPLPSGEYAGLFCVWHLS